jgi:arsenite oxidase small subunit
MRRCDLLVDAGRRRFLSGAGIAAAGAAATTVMPAKAATDTVPKAL